MSKSIFVYSKTEDRQSIIPVKNESIACAVAIRQLKEHRDTQIYQSRSNNAGLSLGVQKDGTLLADASFKDGKLLISGELQTELLKAMNKYIEFEDSIEQTPEYQKINLYNTMALTGEVTKEARSKMIEEMENFLKKVELPPYEKDLFEHTIDEGREMDLVTESRNENVMKDINPRTSNNKETALDDYFEQFESISDSTR